MMLSKWILLLGAILLLGLPIGVKSETPIDETKQSSAKECRLHIEKALEQYWEQKEPPHEENIRQAGRTTLSNDDNENEDDQELQNTNNYENQNEQNTSPIDEENENETEGSDDDETDESDNSDETEDDENNSITEDENTEDLSENNIKDFDEEEEDEDEDEEELNTEENNDEESDDEVDEEEEANDEEKTNDEEETEEEEETTEEEGTEVEEETTDEEETEEEEETNDEEPQEEEEDENDDDTESEDAEEGDNSANERNEDKVTEHVDSENQDILSKSAEGEGHEDEVPNPSIVQEINQENIISYETTVDETGASKNHQTESQEVTGETDSASSGVASELSPEEQSVERTQTAVVEDETSTLTTSQEENQKEEPGEQIVESESETTVEEMDKDDDTIENIYEEDEDDDSTATLTYRSRDHVDVILGLDEIGTEYDKEEEKLAQSIFREIKKIELTMIKPMEMLYKYADSTTRSLGDAEIFSKPMLLFLGPWSAGKTTIINYLLGLERTPATLKTGTGITDVDFSLITYGDQRQVISGTELVADWKYAGLQKFGQRFLDHLRSIQIPHTLLKKVTIVDTPGILENRKNTERGYSLSAAFQWFIDRADAIYVVLDPTKVDIGSELGSVLDHLKGRDVRFILNKADTIRRSDLMRVVGQLFWNLSPLMSSTEAPVIYAVSLTTKPYHPSAPVKFLADQEKNFLYDMKDTLDKRIENRILYARRHAVRVRNHANMVDCYLATYYKHKSIFSNKKNVAKLITENPREYSIFEGLSSMTNVSRYELPDPVTYKEFFKLHPLYDFKPLASTCSYFRGCPMDKVDAAIAKEIPELFAKYKKAKNSFDAPKQEGR